MNGERIFVCGGDKRSIYMADYFRREGYIVDTFGLFDGNEDLGNVSLADIVVLGLPALKDGRVNMPLCNEQIPFEELIAFVSKGTRIAGGRWKNSDVELLEQAEIEFADYSEDEIFQTENALYTAEGAVCKIIENTADSLCGMKLCILGGGRISKALCALLANAPCSITVCARNPVQRTFFAVRGIDVRSDFCCMEGFDVIINTIPADILTREVLGSADKDTLMVDLSARPGYVSEGLCTELGLRLLYLPGIPLASAPRSAGISAAKAVLRMLT